MQVVEHTTEDAAIIKRHVSPATVIFNSKRHWFQRCIARQAIARGYGWIDLVLFPEIINRVRFS